ncbi:hypothetical protein BBO01nite_36660 [Brevibacillus borstelensis]|nr:hypothetical protein BBO01nite_36660 [Brevibacillus borstelensis]
MFCLVINRLICGCWSLRSSFGIPILLFYVGSEALGFARLQTIALCYYVPPLVKISGVLLPMPACSNYHEQSITSFTHFLES